jgi:Txe/YoeB family toxin of Txe-Axe toxin-antitoxin module
VFDFVPLAGAGRTVADDNGQPEDTAELARAIQEEERRTAEKIWQLISPWAATAFKKLAGAEQLTA